MDEWAHGSMSDLAYYLSFALNGLVATCAFFAARASIKAGRADEKRAKFGYSWVILLGGLVSGSAFFPAAVSLLRSFGWSVGLGHGEILVAAAVGNLLLALVLLVIGRVLLGWQPLDWR